MMSGKCSGPPSKRLRQTLLCFGTGSTSETSRSVPALPGTKAMSSSILLSSELKLLISDYENYILNIQQQLCRAYITCVSQLSF